MGNLVFAKYPGSSFPNQKEAAAARTIIQTSASGKEVRINPWSGTLPQWKFQLNFEFLRSAQPYTAIGQVPATSTILSLNPLVANDHHALEGFILSVGGSWDSWLFDDWNDDFISRSQLGTANGVTTAFQISRQWGAYAETIQNLNGTPVLAADWQPSTAFALNALAVPTQAAILTQAGLVYAWQTPGWPNYFSCTTAGTTGALEPKWRSAPVPGATVTDGSAVWTNMGVPLVAYIAQAAIPDYVNSTVYALGNVIKPVTSNALAHYFICTTAGTAGLGTTWGQIVGGTTTTGGAIFQDLGLLIQGVNFPIRPMLPSAYTVGPTGVLTFTTAPLSGGQVYVTCGFYFRCRFDKDSETFEQFWSGFWSVKSLNFTSLKL